MVACLQNCNASDTLGQQLLDTGIVIWGVLNSEDRLMSGQDIVFGILLVSTHVIGCGGFEVRLWVIVRLVHVDCFVPARRMKAQTKAMQQKHHA